MITSVWSAIKGRASERMRGLAWIEGAFLAGVACLLVATATLKLHAGVLTPEAIPGREGLYEIPLRTWSVVAGIAELLAVGLILGAPSRREAQHVVRFFFACLLTYRFAQGIQGGGPCGCLGPLLANSPWQAKEGLLLGSVAGAVFLLNEVFLLRRRLLPPSAFPSQAVGPSTRAVGTSRATEIEE